MNDEDVVRSGHLLSLIARSALDSPERAVKAWSCLTDEIPFEHLPNIAIRAMPQIYLNVCHQKEVRHLARLKGVYRSSWSNNAMRFASLRKFFDQMNAEGVNYRIIKGGAISALVGHWGLRRMGDIDVVIAPTHEPLVQEILKSLHFVPPIDTAWARAGSHFVEGSWNDGSGALLDLHSTTEKPKLFANLFEEDGITAPLTGALVRIPSPQLMLALAVWHGKREGASTDYVQTLLDLGTLLKMADLADARKFLIQSNLRESAQEFVAVLGAMGLASTKEIELLSARSPTDWFFELAANSKKIVDLGGRLIRIPRVVWRRRINDHQQRKLRAQRGIRARLYQLWVNCGQLGQLESAIYTFLGGFGEFQNPGGPIPERDFRVRIQKAADDSSILLLHFSFESPGPQRAHRNLYINGKLHGSVPLPGGEAGVYDVSQDHDFVEISVRAPNSLAESEVVHSEYRWIER